MTDKADYPQASFSQFQMDEEFLSVSDANKTLVRILALCPSSPPSNSTVGNSDASTIRPDTKVSPAVAHFLLDQAQLSVIEIENTTPSTDIGKNLDYLGLVSTVIQQFDSSQVSFKPEIDAFSRHLARLRQRFVSLDNQSSSAAFAQLQKQSIKREYARVASSFTNVAYAWLDQADRGFSTLSLRWGLVENIEYSEKVLLDVDALQVGSKPHTSS